MFLYSVGSISRSLTPSTSSDFPIIVPFPSLFINSDFVRFVCFLCLSVLSTFCNLFFEGSTGFMVLLLFLRSLASVLLLGLPKWPVYLWLGIYYACPDNSTPKLSLMLSFAFKGEAPITISKLDEFLPLSNSTFEDYRYISFIVSFFNTSKSWSYS